MRKEGRKERKMRGNVRSLAERRGNKKGRQEGGRQGRKKRLREKNWGEGQEGLGEVGGGGDLNRCQTSVDKLHK